MHTVDARAPQFSRGLGAVHNHSLLTADINRSNDLMGTALVAGDF